MVTEHYVGERRLAVEHRLVNLKPDYTEGECICRTDNEDIELIKIRQSAYRNYRQFFDVPARKRYADERKEHGWLPAET